MAQSDQLHGDTPQNQHRKEYHRIKAAPYLNGLDPQDTALIVEFLDALNPDNYAVNPGDIGTKSYSTLAAYGQNIRLLAKAANKPLRELSELELNQLFSDMDVGQNTLASRQSAARVFYRYHDQLGIDESLITIDRPDTSPVEARDLFTRSDVDAIHEACTNARDRAMIDLMLYTGQRIRAIQSLRVGGIDLDENRFYLNTDAAGLKGAKGMRPLLVARASVSEWMQNHPAKNDPDAYFITKLPDASKGNVHEQLHQSTINRRIHTIVADAGIERAKERSHPHNLRHSFVRWAYVNRDMDIPTIKYMMGHSKDSHTLEKTYMNIFESDFARKAEEKAGVTPAEEPEDHLTPETCPICDFGPLPDGSRACPRCTNILTPDGANELQEAQQRAESSIPQIENEKEAKIIGSVLKQLRENPGDYLDE